MVTNERIRELFARASIPRGMWVAVSEERDCDGKDGRIETTGNSRDEVQGLVSRMRGKGDVAIVQNV